MHDIHIVGGPRVRGNLIAGREVPSASGEVIPTVNPATGEVIATLARGGKEDVDRAVQSARATFEGPWSACKPAERQLLLMRIHDVIEANFEELAYLETIDMGAPLSHTRKFKAFVLQAIRFYATQTNAVCGQTLPNSLVGNFMTMTLKAPVGVVGGIIPWNGPLASVWWLVGATLATGCTLVLKPSEEASLSTLRIVELLYEAGMPDGVVNVVTGLGSEAGAPLAEHPNVDRVAFTGSTETGRSIIRASAGNIKRLQLELGGKSPDIVFADADLDTAVPSAAMAVFRNSGQVCYAGTRLLVERRIQQEFTERLVAFTQTLKVGNGLEEGVHMGPLVSSKQLDRVMGYIGIAPGEGASLAAGGRRLGGVLGSGYFVEPTVFTNVCNTMTIAREEIFGPVMSVIPFDTPEQALSLANDTEFGLGGAVWSRDISKAIKIVQSLRSGTVWVNSYGVVDPAVGFGGTKLSGYGMKGGPSHLDAFLSNKCVYINVG
jgi:aldehyde dehydrogenase (NAD+)